MDLISLWVTLSFANVAVSGSQRLFTYLNVTDPGTDAHPQIPSRTAPKRRPFRPMDSSSVFDI